MQYTMLYIHIIIAACINYIQLSRLILIEEVGIQEEFLSLPCWRHIVMFARALLLHDAVTDHIVSIVGYGFWGDAGFRNLS